VRNTELLSQGGKEYPTNNGIAADRIGHILLGNCLIEQFIERKMEGKIYGKGR
jgi:hypothetical protein